MDPRIDYFGQLPEEMVEKVGEYLDYPSLGRFGRTYKTAQRITTPKLMEEQERRHEVLVNRILEFIKSRFTYGDFERAKDFGNAPFERFRSWEEFMDFQEEMLEDTEDETLKEFESLIGLATYGLIHFMDKDDMRPGWTASGFILNEGGEVILFHER